MVLPSKAVSSAFLGWPSAKTGIFSCNSDKWPDSCPSWLLTLFRSCCLFPFSLHFASWQNGHNPKSLLSAKVILKENILSHFLRTLSSLQHHIRDPKKKRESGIELTRKAEEETQSKLYGQCEKTWACGVSPWGTLDQPPVLPRAGAEPSSRQWQHLCAAYSVQTPLFLTFSLPVCLCFPGPPSAASLAFSGVAAEQVSPSSWGREESCCCHSRVTAKGVGQHPQGSMLAKPCRPDGWKMKKDRRRAAHGSHLWVSALCLERRDQDKEGCCPAVQFPQGELGARLFMTWLGNPPCRHLEVHSFWWRMGLGSLLVSEKFWRSTAFKSVGRQSCDIP